MQIFKLGKAEEEMHPIENILKTTMSELKEMVDVNTIVGAPFIAPDGATIIPISKLSFGFVSGGGEYSEEGKKVNAEGNAYPFAGGTATGISISPVAFMVGSKEELKLLTVSDRTALDKVIENVPRMMSELKDMLGASRKCDKKKEEEVEARA